MPGVGIYSGGTRFRILSQETASLGIPMPGHIVFNIMGSAADKTRSDGVFFPQPGLRFFTRFLLHPASDWNLYGVTGSIWRKRNSD